ncbi:hypothetical protein WJ15_10905 [Burkholderia cepacia]|nr:hypothetical protein WJ15_10905 [Burkholderia cepacia]
MSLLDLDFRKGAGKRGPCRMEFQIEMLTRATGNLQPATHDFSTRMPEVDHPQKVLISWRQCSPRSGHILGVNGIIGTTIRPSPVA